MIFKQSPLVLVTAVILSASLFVSGCSRGRMQNTTEALDMSLSITTSAPTPAPTTTAKETTSVQTTTKSATTQTPTTQEATTAAPTTTKPTTAATTTRPTTAKPTTQEATTTAPTTTQAPTTQATTTAAPTTTQAPTTQATTTEPTPAAPTPVPQPAISPSQIREEIFRLTNVARVENGLPPFERAAPEFWEMAGIRAEETSHLLSHQRPNGEGSHTVAYDYGYDVTWLSLHAYGENLYRGTGHRYSPQSIVDCWMNSPGHRATILDAKCKYLAIGYYYGVAHEVTNITTGEDVYAQFATQWFYGDDMTYANQ